MSTLTLAHPTAAADWEKLLEFSKLVRPEGDHQALVRLYRDQPDLTPEDHAMLLDEDGVVVATASLLPHHHYFGDTELEVGELSLCATHPDRRLEGHAKRLIQHWLEEAKARNYAYVYLTGLPRVFDGHGFAYSAPAHYFPSLRMSREVLEPVLSPYRVRPLTMNDVAAVEDLYDRVNCRTRMAEVRSHDYWMYRLAHTRQGGFGWWVAVDANNQPHGYVWADLTRARLREVVAADDEASRAILQWMRWELTERKLPEFTAQVPLDQTFARLAHRCGALIANPHAFFPGNWAAMIKILAFQPLVEGLKSRFEANLNDSRYAGREFSATLVLTANGAEEAVSLRFHSGHMLVGPGHMGQEIRLPAMVWAPLLTGYRTIDDFPHLDLAEPVRHLLRTLFTPGYPYMWDLEQGEAL